MHPIQLFSALPSTGTQCNHAVHQLADSSIAAPAHTVVSLSLSLSLSLIMHVARASVSTLTWKRTRHLKAPGSCRQLTFHSPFSRKHGAETGRSRLCVPNPLHRRVCTMAAFSNMQHSTTTALRLWANGGENRACEERTFTNLRDVRERGGGSVVLTALNSASDVCCSVSNPSLLPSSLVCSPAPAPLPPSAIKNRCYSVMRRLESPQRKSKNVRTVVFKYKHMYAYQMFP